jgi:hypothetical protein
VIQFKNCGVLTIIWNSDVKWMLWCLLRRSALWAWSSSTLKMESKKASETLDMNSMLTSLVA